MATAALSHKLGEHKIPRITTWAPRVCRIMAFYRCWAIVLPTFGGLGTLETCSFAHVERMRKRAFLKIGFGFDIDAFRCRVSTLYTLPRPKAYSDGTVEHSPFRFEKFLDFS